MQPLLNDIFVIGAVYCFIIPPVVALWYFLKASHKRKGIMLVYGIALALVAYGIAGVLNHFINDPRPFVVSGTTPSVPYYALSFGDTNGFPSGHTLFCALFAAFLWPFYRRPAMWLWAVAIFVGISRVYVGVHHIMDIIASLVIVAFASWLVWTVGFKKRFRTKTL